jgi:surfactin synthase thioesterase subunit
VLSTPVVAFAGTEDPVAPLPDVETWTEHTTGGFGLIPLSGGHFFLPATRA